VALKEAVMANMFDSFLQTAGKAIEDVTEELSEGDLEGAAEAAGQGAAAIGETVEDGIENLTSTSTGTTTQTAAPRATSSPLYVTADASGISIDANLGFVAASVDVDTDLSDGSVGYEATTTFGVAGVGTGYATSGDYTTNEDGGLEAGVSSGVYVGVGDDRRLETGGTLNLQTETVQGATVYTVDDGLYVEDTAGERYEAGLTVNAGAIPVIDEEGIQLGIGGGVFAEQVGGDRYEAGVTANVDLESEYQLDGSRDLQAGFDLGGKLDGPDYSIETGVTANMDLHQGADGQGQVGLDAGVYVEDTGGERFETGATVNIDLDEGQQGGVDAGVFAESTDRRFEAGVDFNIDHEKLAGGEQDSIDIGVYAETDDARYEAGVTAGVREGYGESDPFVGVYAEGPDGRQQAVVALDPFDTPDLANPGTGGAAAGPGATQAVPEVGQTVAGNGTAVSSPVDEGAGIPADDPAGTSPEAVDSSAEEEPPAATGTLDGVESALDEEIPLGEEGQAPPEGSGVTIGQPIDTPTPSGNGPESPGQQIAEDMGIVPGQLVGEDAPPPVDVIPPADVIPPVDVIPLPEDGSPPAGPPGCEEEAPEAEAHGHRGDHGPPDERGNGIGQLVAEATPGAQASGAGQDVPQDSDSTPGAEALEVAGDTVPGSIAAEATPIGPQEPDFNFGAGSTGNGPDGLPAGAQAGSGHGANSGQQDMIPPEDAGHGGGARAAHEPMEAGNHAPGQDHDFGANASEDDDGDWTGQHEEFHLPDFDEGCEEATALPVDVTDDAPPPIAADLADTEA
jgi:hypothetical protein